MKAILKYSWLVIMLVIVIHGASIIRSEWQRKSIHDHGEMVEVNIEELDCSNGIMTFLFGTTSFKKNIDLRTCALLNKGQKIKLKHSTAYPSLFMFANERNPNRFILGSLEIVLGLIGFLITLPLAQTKRYTYKNFPRLSDN